MPFTPVHALAMLPFKKFIKKNLSVLAFIIGCMIPDFEFYFRMTLYGIYGHTLKGIFIFDLPAGLLIYFTFEYIIRNIMVLHLPEYFWTKFNTFICPKSKRLNLKNHITIIISLILGILTHFIWDGFTHDEEYYIARYIPILTKELSLYKINLPVHTILHIGSSILGMIYLVFLLSKFPNKPLQRSIITRDIYFFWIKICSLTIVLVIIRYLFGIPNEKLIAQYVVVVISAFLYATLIVSLFYLKKENKYSYESKT